MRMVFMVVEGVKLVVGRPFVFREELPAAILTIPSYSGGKRLSSVKNY